MELEGRAETQSPVSAQNILVPELNPKPLHSKFVIKRYVLLLAIRPSDEDLNLAALVVLFDKGRLMLATEFLHHSFSSLIHHSYIT